MGPDYRGGFWGLGRSTIVIAGLVAALLGTAGMSFGLLTTSTPVSNTGVIVSVNVGVYTTVQCTVNLTQISWGTVQPGSNNTHTAYIRNNGNSNMTLSMSTTNWNPAAASSGIGVSWDYGGAVVRPGQVLAVTWKLSVKSTISGIQNFGFDIVVSGGG